MSRRFTIGEMAKLHNIPVKTLRYYDEIDLFNPIEVDPETNYRYYGTEQFEHLNTISYLRELGISLKDIKHQFDERNLELFKYLLETQEQQVEKQIEQLKRAKQRLTARVNELENINNYECGKPMIKRIGTRRIAQLKQSIHSHEELELAIKNLEHQSRLNSSIYIGGIGVTRSVDQLMKPVYNSVFLMIEDENVSCSLSTILEEGFYVTLALNRERIYQEDYKPLLEFIQSNGFNIKGDAIERVIVDGYITQNKNEHLSEIQIPVQ